ncbi:outer membrane lipoprotein-sorting protein [Photobacterium makurazakiensis]
MTRSPLTIVRSPVDHYCRLILTASIVITASMVINVNASSATSNKTNTLLPVFSSTVITQEGLSAEQKGLVIATEMVNRDTGYQSYASQVTMDIIAANGDSAHRELTIKGQEQSEDGDRIITAFQAPRDIAGTTLLTYSHAIEADDQWLYLPSIKRVKRISSNNRSGPFMGSEFAYEDMSSWELDKYRYVFIDTRSEGGKQYWVIACYPQYANSGYTKIIAWIDQTIFQPRKIEYFDRKNSPLKVLTLTDFQQYQQQYWRAHVATMVNLQNQRTTRLTWHNFELGLPLNSRQFEPNQLRFAYQRQ